MKKSVACIVVMSCRAFAGGVTVTAFAPPAVDLQQRLASRSARSLALRESRRKQCDGERRDPIFLEAPKSRQKQWTAAVASSMVWAAVFLSGAAPAANADTIGKEVEAPTLFTGETVEVRE
jgi:hypothetical protein